MNKQFNLSNHITNKSHSSGNIPVVRVKEFIDLILERYNFYYFCGSLSANECEQMRLFVKELAGDKLVK